MDPLNIDLLEMATIDLDHSFFIQLAIVLTLMAVLNKIVFKPFLRSIELRDAKTVDARREAAELKTRAETLESEYRTRLAAARSVAVTARQAIRIDADAKKVGIVGEARNSASAELNASRTKSAEQVESARTALLGEVDALSTLVVEKVLGRGV